MPTYDYRCDNCGKEKEMNLPIMQRDIHFECSDDCDGELIRVISFNGLTWAPTAGGMR